MSSIHEPVKLGYLFDFKYPPEGKELKVVAGVLHVTNLPGEYLLTIVDSDGKVLESHKFKIPMSSMIAPILKNIEETEKLLDGFQKQVEAITTKSTPK